MAGQEHLRLPVTNGYYVARHLEKRVERPVDPTVRDMQTFPSIYISYYDAAGTLLIRYDHNPPMPIPATCPTDRGADPQRYSTSSGTS